MFLIVGDEVLDRRRNSLRLQTFHVRGSEMTYEERLVGLISTRAPKHATRKMRVLGVGLKSSTAEWIALDVAGRGEQYHGGLDFRLFAK